ncbi:hypothetical protein GJ698_06600 [Pseudoduganella sp. FT26W]|uniref:Lipoprotein n=1 Tax=Duganella aquatilis TaxID=2666082 RepID=A0A844CTT9_9BURK|nr:hypothetical protein [Duganella aquatilis]MRW83763.1 hypothetical protein [Duganella aquatilis]
MRLVSGCSVLLLFLLTGCAAQIYYPDVRTFASGDLDSQLNTAKAMLDEYSKTKKSLAGSGNANAQTNIGLGVISVSAAAFGAPVDVLKTLTIGTGAHTVGNSTFNADGQMGVYRAGEIALMCVVDKATKLKSAQSATFNVSLSENFSVQSTPNALVTSLQSGAKTQCQLLKDGTDKAEKEGTASSENIAKARARIGRCEVHMEQFRASMNSLAVKAAEAANVRPEQVLSDTLRSIDHSVFEKLRSTLAVKDAATVASELKTQIDALKAKEETGKAGAAAQDANNLEFMGVSSMKRLTALDSADIQKLTQAIEDKLTFEAELQKCASSAGL